MNTDTPECQHELKSLPLTSLHTLYYWCTKCERHLEKPIEGSMDELGWSLDAMHTKFSQELGGTYIGKTTYDPVSK